MTIAPGTDVAITIPNARIAKYDPDTDRYFIHSPAFYGGAWIDARDVTPPPASLDELVQNMARVIADWGYTIPKETP